jgi:steroid delta-isomerase-like uncharacterized protein
MSEENNQAVVRQVFEEVWNKGDLARVQEFFAPDYIHHHPLDPSIHGVEGHRRLATMMRAAFPDLQYTLEDQFAAEDKVATRWTARGTHQGAFRDIAPTGRPAEWTGIVLSRLANGKIVEVWEEFNAVGLRQQLTGASPRRTFS